VSPAPSQPKPTIVVAEDDPGMARHAGNTQELLTRVWGAEYRHENHVLQVNIARLRQKLEPDPRVPRSIITRAGLGYMVPRPPGPEPAAT